MKVSVVIPTYNGEQTLERAITSVINQTALVEFEILVCDDCSTDETVWIAERLGATVIMNDKHTGGPNAGRNHGILAASGDMIAFLDQDDEWLPGKVENQLVKMETGYDVVSSGQIVRDESPRPEVLHEQHSGQKPRRATLRGILRAVGF